MSEQDCGTLETIVVPLSAGHTLEIDVYGMPTGTQGPTPQRIVVLCHPWSWLGGCKDDP